MNIKPLFEKQYENNSKISIDSSLDKYKLSARKNLELNIKLSSLAEETKCYKYWIDDNTDINTDIVFQKYLDLFSQIITLGLDKGYVNSYDVKIIKNEYCLSDQFLNIYIDINDLTISPSEDHYQTLLEDFFTLGLSLGYTEKRIFDLFMIN